MGKKAERPDSIRLVGMEIFYWLACSCGAFLVVFLQEQGMSASQIGLINAVNSAIVIVSVPLWGVIGDRLRSIKKVYLITMIASLVLFPMIALSAHLPVGAKLVMTAMVIVANFFRTPAQSLMDSLVVQVTSLRRLNYGAIRAAGSISFAVVGIVLGIMLPYIGVESTFYLFALLLLPNLLIGYSLKETGTGPTGYLSFRELHIEQLFKNYYYVTFLIFVFIFNLSVSSEYTFLPYILEHIGVDGSRYGVIIGYRALVEAPMLFLMIRLRKKLPLQYLIMAGVFFYGVEPFMMAIASSLGQMVLFTTLYGIGSGLVIGASAIFCFYLAPEQLKATAMTVYTAVGSVSGIIGNSLGGVLLERYGVVALFNIDGIVFMISILFYGAALLIGSRILKLKQPGRVEA